jgi:lysophospholipase L1-like esterase
MPAPANAFKIMPLGDSITEGTVAGGYRAPLYSLLTMDGYNISYAGDQKTNSGGGLPSNEDSHEGFPGDTSADVHSEIDGNRTIQRNLPNVVLLEVGTNDIGYGASYATADSNIAALMDDIIGKDPTVHIFLANVLHRADDGTGWVTAFDATLPSIVAPRAPYVTLVDMASAVSLADLDPGGLHPVQSGYNKMAVAWEAAIKSYFGLSLVDTTTNQVLPAVATPYFGPVAGPTSEYVKLTPDSLNITASTPNWFIHSGGGDNAIAVSSGTNVLDGGAGSSFLTGGAGADTFYVDDRNPASNVWSSIVNFHSGDNATVWGITPADFNLTWLANQGASGATGLTGVFVSNTAGRPTAAITLSGFTPADLTNGKLSISYGTTADLPNLPGSHFMTIHGN